MRQNHWRQLIVGRGKMPLICRSKCEAGHLYNFCSFAVGTNCDEAMKRSDKIAAIYNLFIIATNHRCYLHTYLPVSNTAYIPRKVAIGWFHCHTETSKRFRNMVAGLTMMLHVCASANDQSIATAWRESIFNGWEITASHLVGCCVGFSPMQRRFKSCSCKVRPT